MGNFDQIILTIERTLSNNECRQKTVVVCKDNMTNNCLINKGT